MKYAFYLLFATTLLVFSSCDKTEDDHDHGTKYDYHAHILSPDDSNKNRGETLNLKVEFESHAGEPVHHVQVRIYKKSDNTEIYRKPNIAHINNTSGKYVFEDNIIMNAANGFADHAHYVVEAKVWGEKEGDGEKMETVEFHVH